MNVNEIKEATIEDAIHCAKAMACLEVCEECRFYGLCHTWCDDVYRIIIQALEEIQQYRAIGTVEQIMEMQFATEQEHDEVLKYRAIGTIEEFKALKEKNEPKKPIDKIMYLECPTCGDVGILDCGYCSVCGQKLDWQ